MISVRTFFLASAAAISFGCEATAADMPQNPPQVIIQQVPVPVVQEFNGWYLRGDIGMTNQKVKEISHPSFATAPGFTFLDKGEFTSGMSYGFGVGYQVNDWLRLDVTGEYRGGVDFTALDRFSNAGVFNTNDYRAVKKEWLFLANAYLDLGTWWCITPFIGAGVGFSNLTIGNFRDTNVIAGGGGWASDNTETNFAWALHAGLAYNVNQNFAIELSYRYLNLGDGKTGNLLNLDPTFSSGNAISGVTFKDITSHDVRLGVRWTCCDDNSAGVRRPVAYSPPPPPVYSQPLPQPQVIQAPPVYTPPPPPVYTQPQYSPPPVYSQPQYAPPPPSYQQQYQPQYQQPLSRRG
jgi:opacity protein-like surface antigen